jgi:uncharacterized BrkB/YihY/UPF0761 family membrane protein
LVADRFVKIVVLLAVTLVLLLIGFSGTSVDITPPGPEGWIYIGVVIVASTLTFMWLYRVNVNSRRGSPSGPGRMVNPRSKRIPLG